MGTIVGTGRATTLMLGTCAGACLALACNRSDETVLSAAAPQAYVSIEIPLTAATCDVASAEVTWTAAEGQSQTVALEVEGDSVSGRIDDVPVGEVELRAALYGSGGNLTYSASTTVDVREGEAVSARLVLYPNLEFCSDPAPVGEDPIETDAGPGTGSILVEGVFADAGAGALPSEVSGSLAFDEASLSENGVVFLFEQAANTVHRLDLVTRTWQPDLVGTDSTTAFAVSSDGGYVYLAYTGGRMDVFDTSTGSASFFAAAPATVSTALVADDYLFTIDNSGSWDTQSLFDRATGARVFADDWRDTARSIVYADELQKVFLLNSGVSPTDVNMVEVNLAEGTLGTEIDSPYHGDYSLPNPIRLTPDQSSVVVGSGNFFSTTDLSYQFSLGLSFTDIAFLGDSLYLLDTVGELAQVRVLDAGFNIVGAEFFEGSGRRVFAHGGQLVLLTEQSGEVTFSWHAPSSF